MSLNLRSGMTFLSQVRPVRGKDKIIGARQRLPREASLTKDDSPGSWQALGNLTEQAAKESGEIFIWFKGQINDSHLRFLLLFSWRQDRGMPGKAGRYFGRGARRAEQAQGRVPGRRAKPRPSFASTCPAREPAQSV